MSARVALLLLLAGAPGTLAACFQELDTNADSDPTSAPGSSSGAQDASPSAGLSSWQTCQSPSCDDANGTIPFLQQTPAIYLPDGGTTSDPCVDVEAASVSIRQTYCASCHGPGTGAGQGGFDYVLDDPSLLGSSTTSATFPHFVVPGAPSQSYLYVSIASGQMPPASMAGAPSNPVPTASDLSVLYGWILACCPGSDAGYVSGGGGFYGPGAPDAGDTADGDGVPDGGAD